MNCWFRGPHWLLVEILPLKGKRKGHIHCCIVPFPSGTLAHHNLKTGPICFPFISEQTSEKLGYSQFCKHSQCLPMPSLFSYFSLFLKYSFLLPPEQILTIL